MYMVTNEKLKELETKIQKLSILLDNNGICSDSTLDCLKIIESIKNCDDFKPKDNKQKHADICNSIAESYRLHTNESPEIRNAKIEAAKYCAVIIERRG